MEKQTTYMNHVQMEHKCDWRCLGSLSFHPQVVGSMVRLSHGNRLAERNPLTFRYSLVFSSRPVKRREAVCLKVLKTFPYWNGSLRVGFTNVPPSERSLPLPSMAIPLLTKTQGHWAAPVYECFCKEGSELRFWVSLGGNVYILINKSTKRKLISGVDLSKPLWAMIDIYGQACSIFLMGSEKRGLITQRSCPAPEPLISPECHTGPRSTPDVSDPDEDTDKDTDISKENSCVVCMAKESSVTQACGHRCLCERCYTKVSQQFGTCPLCRHQMRAPSEQPAVSALC